MFAAFLLGESCLLQVLLVAGHNLVRLVRSLEMTLSSPNIPPEILATLLNLVSLSRSSILKILIHRYSHEMTVLLKFEFKIEVLHVSSYTGL